MSIHKLLKINHPRHRHEEEYEAVKRWCVRQDMEDWYICSRDGLKLHASYLEAEQAQRIVILCHGYKGTRFGSVAHIAPELHEAHCSLLFIDQRCCGESEGRHITFGAKEQYDILGWIKRLQKANPQRIPVYLYGQSMGGASVLLAAGHELPEEVRGLIADCAFHSMEWQLRDMARDWFYSRHPELFLLRMELFCRVFAGFSMKETDTTQALRSNRLPVLFFHGKEDGYVRPENTRRNYMLCRAEKEMLLIPQARHLCCSYEEPELYLEKIRQFFAKYDAMQEK